MKRRELTERRRELAIGHFSSSQCTMACIVNGPARHPNYWPDLFQTRNGTKVQVFQIEKKQEKREKLEKSEKTESQGGALDIHAEF